jgi:hypothetical protein
MAREGHALARTNVEVAIKIEPFSQTLAQYKEARAASRGARRHRRESKTGEPFGPPA